MNGEVICQASDSSLSKDLHGLSQVAADWQPSPNGHLGRYSQNSFIGIGCSLSEEERKRDRVNLAEENSEKDEGSVLSCSSIPVDFGDSLPPNLTTLVNKRFCLYRLNKSEDTELGVLITKKLNRDRRTSGGFSFVAGIVNTIPQYNA